MVKRAVPPLVLERVLDNINLYILSIIEYKRKHYLCIIDNIGPTQISAFVLDFATRENIDINEFLSLAIRWYYGESTSQPLSVYLTKLGLKEISNKILKNFNKAYVGRVIGQPFSYNLTVPKKQRKRRANKVSADVMIKVNGEKITVEEHLKRLSAHQFPSLFSSQPG